MDTEDLEDLDPLHYSPVDVNGGLFGLPFPVARDPLVDYTIRSWTLPQCLADSGVGVVHSHTVMVEQGVQDGDILYAHTPEGSPWQMCFCLPSPPGGVPSGSPGSSCRGLTTPELSNIARNVTLLLIFSAYCSIHGSNRGKLHAYLRNVTRQMSKSARRKIVLT